MNEAISVFAGVVVMVAVGGLTVAGMVLLVVMTWRMIKGSRGRRRT